jgi:hypothetical protein
MTHNFRTRPLDTIRKSLNIMPDGDHPFRHVGEFAFHCVAGPQSLSRIFQDRHAGRRRDMLLAMARPAAISLSKNTRWLLLAASAPLAAVLLYVLLWPVPVDETAPRYISITFTGFTNDPSGRTVAVFSLSNVTTFAVNCPVVGPQIQITNRTKSTTNIVWAWEPGDRSMPLQSGESATIQVSRTNGAPWRFAVMAERPPGLAQATARKLQSRLPRPLYWRLYGDPRRTQFLVSRVFSAGEIPPDSKQPPGR